MFYNVLWIEKSRVPRPFEDPWPHMSPACAGPTYYVHCRLSPVQLQWQLGMRWLLGSSKVVSMNQRHCRSHTGVYFYIFFSSTFLFARFNSNCKTAKASQAQQKEWPAAREHLHFRLAGANVNQILVGTLCLRHIIRLFCDHCGGGE